MTETEQIAKILRSAVIAYTLTKNCAEYEQKELDKSKNTSIHCGRKVVKNVRKTN